MGDKTEEGWERVKKKWDNVFKTCMDVWEDKIEDLKKKGKAVLNTIEKEATKVWNKVERSPWFQDLESKGKEIIDKANKMKDDIINGAKSTAQNIVNGAKSTAQNIINGA